MHFERKTKYKARTPEETIRNIRNILYDADIFVSENSIYQKLSKTCACSVRFGDEVFDDLNFATNGKGMNARYALASAYAEFMERLQAVGFLKDYRKQAYQRGGIKYQIAPDEETVIFSEFNEASKQAIKIAYSLTEEEYKDIFSPIMNVGFKCVKYYDVFNDSYVSLPLELFSPSMTSNGYCAGNTREEALAQGISELFERQSLMRIYRDNVELPQLSRECFEGTAVKEKLDYLETQGYQYKIIDASMGLSYPVIGLRLEYDGGIMFNLGADPNPVVALERCLTEEFQNIEEGKHLIRLSKTNIGLFRDCKFKIAKKWYYSNFLRAKVVGGGDKPDNLFHIPEEYSTSYTYNKEEDSDYKYLINLIKSLGYHLYIRDFSYLGFPSYGVFIPEISLADIDHIGWCYKTVNYFTGMIEAKKANEEQYEKLLPILQYLEKKQLEYYK